MVAMISYFSNLCGCLTNYSTGQVVIYFGFGYVSPQRWFSVGLAVAMFHLTVWLGVGLPYWKLLGWW
jgi:DASS family divalent anion:Na+ symporter